VDSAAAAARPRKDGFAGGGDAPGGQDRLGPATAVVHREVRGVQEQIVQFDAGQLAPAPGVVLGHDGLADGRDRRFGQHGLGAERVGERTLDVAHAHAAHEGGGHQRLQRVGAGDTGAEQAGGERAGGAAQLRAGDGDRPAGGLDGGRAVPVAVPGPYRALLGVAGIGGDGRGALVAGAAGKGVHLGFDGGLDDQAGSETGDVLDDLDQVTAFGEQGVDLGADGLDGR